MHSTNHAILPLSWDKSASASCPPKTKNVGQSNSVCVTARNVEDGSLHIHHATLVVGADGMNSKVRQCLATSSSTIWNSHKGFSPKSFSPSDGPPPPPICGSRCCSSRRSSRFRMVRASLQLKRRARTFTRCAPLTRVRGTTSRWDCCP